MMTILTLCDDDNDDKHKYYYHHRATKRSFCKIHLWDGV